MRLDDQTALVTGASRGIGQAIALELAARGATVIGTATSQNGLDNLNKVMKSNGFDCHAFILDVASTASVQDLFKTLDEHDLKPTILVNNAGITRDNLLMRMKDEEWESCINTDLSSLYRLCKACLRGMMKARFGRIINITSVVGLTGNAGQTNYAAAKAGIIGFTKSLAREVGSRGITVNAIAPGFIRSDMTDSLPEAQRETLLQQIPLARLGDPLDIATAVVFLASAAGNYITGETLNVNGGMYMH